jgi:hypothetical protein
MLVSEDGVHLEGSQLDRGVWKQYGNALRGGWLPGLRAAMVRARYVGPPVALPFGQVLADVIRLDDGEDPLARRRLSAWHQTADFQMVSDASPRATGYV